MQRISTLNRVLNLFGVGKDGFKNGDLASGILPTEFNAAWCNGIQEELANVVEAGGIALNAGSVVQLLTALRAAGVFQTAAQFDSTTKAATTAFVQRMGLQSSAINPYNATTALAATAWGSTVVAYGASAITLTLPAALAAPNGARIEFMNASTAAMTIQRAGADTLTVNGSAAITSIVLQPGDTLTLESNGAALFYAVAGSAQLGYSAAFGAALTGSGYQKIPGGLILQWATLSTNSSGTVTWSFPMTFPGACLKAFPAAAGTNIVCGIGATTPSTQLFNVFVGNTGAQAGAQNIAGFAIGY